MKKTFRNNEKLITEFTGKLLRGNLQNSAVDYFLKKISAESYLILSYHGINVDTEKENNILPTNCTFDDFRAQMIIISKYFNIVSLKDIAQHIRGESESVSRKPLAAITFDDGYKNLKESTLPYLKKKKIPVTFFITTGILVKSIIPDFVKTETILINGKAIEKTINYLRNTGFLIKGITKRSEQIALQILQADKKIKEKIFNDLLSDKALMDYVNTYYMSSNDLKDIVSPLFEIASHSHSHRDFSLLSKKEIAEELESSKSILESITGEKVISFAVPFGGERFFRNISNNILNECGYKVCCSTIFGINRKNDNPLMLKRIVVNNFDSIETFMLKISGKLDFLSR